MEIHRAFALAALACVVSSNASAQSCKPDLSAQDKISKRQVDQWQQELTSTGILGAALLGDNGTFTALLGRNGDSNFVAVMIQKEEDNLTRAAFESQYHTAKGDQIILGMKDGEPVTLVAGDVLNQAKGNMFGRLVMTVMLSATVPDQGLARLKDILTKKQVDAVRLALASGQVDRAVNAKNGKKLMEKFTCFYKTLDKRGIDLAAASSAPSSTVATSTESTKAGDATKPAASGLTVDQVIKMVTAKVPDDVIITAVKNGGDKLTLSVDDLLKLKAAGVSDELIRGISR